VAGSAFLQGYSGQSIDELIAMAADYRVGSLVLAVEQALQQSKGREDLSRVNEAELTVLAVESLEREVNNGGYHQFFLNGPEYAPSIVDALRRIGCPSTADISARAVSLIGLRAPFTLEQVEAVLQKDADGKLIEILSDQCDGAYFDSGEPIADRLFDYIRANRRSIRLNNRDSG
jgi:hypothetical protein